MRQLFADTSYWIALLNPRDELHDKAATISNKLSSAKIVTSQMVFTELLNAFSTSGPLVRQAVTRTVNALGKRKNVVVVSQTPEQFSSAMKLYEQSADKSWSLTDCASFRIMQEKQIASALTHDRHFAQAGFEALLR